MKAKKILAVLLSCIMVCGTMTGCQKEKEDDTSKQSEASSTVVESSTQVVEETPLFNEPGVLPIVNEPITLKVLTLDQTTHPTGHTHTSKIWDWLTEKTGIKFEIESYASEDLKTKLPLIMAGDDLPDIFIQCGFSYADLESYAASGKILAMNDLVEEYGYYTKQIMEENTDCGAMYASDGNIYGLPRIAPSKKVGHGYLGINQEWLDNLGLQMPNTLEELYDVLVAFRDEDANGNGDPNDEIPMSTTHNLKNFVTAITSYVGIASYWPVSGAMFDDKDGQVYMVRTSDEYRYLVTWLNKCYEEGLLDNEVFTQSGSELTAKREANRLGVTSTAGYFDYTEKPAGKTLVYAGLDLGSAVSEEPVYGVSMTMNPNLYSISATTEYPEICFMLGDFFYSEEFSWLAENGIPGEAFTWTDEDDYQFTIETDQQNDYKLFTNVWLRDEWYQKPQNDVLATYEEQILENSKSAFQNYLVFTKEESDLISLYSTDMGTVLDEYYVHFITGEKDIETEWDDYVKLVESLHLKELTEVYQAAYDRFYKE